MKQHDETIWVIIEDEPFLSKAKAYREEKQRVLDLYRAFAKERGAEELNMFDRLTGLRFPPGKIPEGWGKPMAQGFSYTKKTKDGEKERQALLALPELPKESDVYGDKIPQDLRYKCGDDGGGFRMIGNFINPIAVGWIGDTFIGRLPDVAAAAKNHLQEHPNDTIEKKYRNWKVPKGLKKVSKAQIDLLTAKYRVEQEEKEKNG